MVWSLYILLCDDKFYYVGITSNTDNRIISHKSKANKATKRYTSLKLVYTEEYKTRREAEKREAQLKKWSRAKKKALIEGNRELLRELSKSWAC